MATEEKVRKTMHKGRVRKDGSTYNPKHNDRNKINKSENIELSLSHLNFYWNRYDGAYTGAEKEGKLTFLEAEAKFYDDHFMPGLARINENYIKNRNRSKVRTMDEYREGTKSAPEETLWYLGDRDNHEDPEILKKVVMEELEWEAQEFPQVVQLDLALHLDEPEGAPHIHSRIVWVGHDKDGNEVANMASAQKEMGIDLRDPTAPGSRYNNAKQVYTKKCLDHFQTLCEKYGLNIEVVPRDLSESGRPIADYKKKKAEERAKEAEEKMRKVEAELAEKTAELETKNTEISAKEAENTKLQTENEALKA